MKRGNHEDEEGHNIILATGHKSYGGRLQQAALCSRKEGGWEPGATDEVVLRNTSSELNFSSAGGLVTAVAPVVVESEGTWVGHPSKE